MKDETTTNKKETNEKQIKQVEVTIKNPPLVAKNNNNTAKNNTESDFFDATIPLDDAPERNIEQEIEEIKKKAILEKEILERTKDFSKNDNKTFISSLIACLVSVGICLALTLIFFLWLKWYGVGLGFAIITLVVSQVWIIFFKKNNKKYEHLENEENTDTLNEER